MKWKCTNCRNELEAGTPPEVCPVCGEHCAYTDGIGLDYAPKPGRGLREGERYRCGVCGTVVQVLTDKGGVLKCCDEEMQRVD